uniref:Uncharacterized protein n=1 Tax=Scleropages formosus TaxID=113540 RepID=A0A8C9WEW6_SCLFO
MQVETDASISLPNPCWGRAAPGSAVLARGQALFGPAAPVESVTVVSSEDISLFRFTSASPGPANNKGCLWTRSRCQTTSCTMTQLLKLSSCIKLKDSGCSLAYAPVRVHPKTGHGHVLGEPSDTWGTRCNTSARF